MLNEHKYKTIYRTETDNISKELIIPALNNSIYYKRGAGFFSLNVLSSLADGIIPFIKNGGKLQVITSINLTEEDKAIIARGESIARERIESIIIEKIENEIVTDKERLSLDLITNLIAAGILTIRIAYTPNGIYHEKIGIFKDQGSNYLCFIGSINATYSGLYKNAESCFVYSSWLNEDARQTALNEEKRFDLLWEDKNEKIRVFSISESIKLKLFSLYKKSDNVETAIKVCDPSSSPSKELYDYQKAAIREFINNNYCHFFEMATGTGKTFTAIKCMELLFQHFGYLSVLILVPQTDLQTQWAESLKDLKEKYDVFLFGGIENAAHTSANFDSFINQSCDFKDNLCIGIAVYDTFFQKLYDKVENINATKLIIVDEAHNLTPQNINTLPNFKYRLGLSATQTRYSVDETEKILHYFTLSKIQPFQYTIDEAIKNGFLSHYNYYPIFVYLDEDEIKEFAKWSKLISIRKNILDKNPNDKDARKDYEDFKIKRSSILKKAKNKIQRLKEMLISNEYDFSNSVIYCGRGKDSETEDSLITIVTSMVSNIGKYSVSQFTSKSFDRREILKKFESGYYDTLVAIKCFDEGIDVPKLDKIYIMASDSQVRQSIQRRGRVLRKCRETGKTIAHIYDFIALPPPGQNIHTADAIKAIELRRVNEYMRLADNKDVINLQISKLFSDYKKIIEGADSDE
mgnify:CR=1 FL=1